MKIKKIFLPVFVWVLGLILNFGIFLYSYKVLTFPYINEEQRVDNAPIIFGVILPLIACAMLIIVVVSYVIFGKRSETS